MPDTPSSSPRPTPEPQRFTARLQPSGQVFAAPGDQPLLLAAQQAGIDLPSSCRNGTCRACRCQLTSGSVRYQIAWPGLSLDEKRSGLILPCVALPTSDVVLAPALDD
ncbi:MAG: 2Fe-2S iron-sulfur cluster-binding protein [Polaromonas sp.]